MVPRNRIELLTRGFSGTASELPYFLTVPEPVDFIGV